jgi:tetratricopeptide (TPR) repeat protein
MPRRTGAAPARDKRYVARNNTVMRPAARRTIQRALRTLLIPAALLVLGAAEPAAAQARPDSLGLFVAPWRPRLAEGADTNDAGAYFNLGLLSVGRSHGVAIAAFYWATRLDPVSPQTYYALHAALVLSDPRRQRHVLQRDSSLPPFEARALDSIGRLYRLMDPIIERGLDQHLLLAFYRPRVERAFRGTGRFRPSDRLIWSTLVRVLDRYDPYMGGILAFSQGRYQDAIEHWEASTRAGWPAGITLADRARALTQLERHDEAAAAMRAALDSIRSREATRSLPWLLPKAELEYSLGRILERAGRPEEAREAYQRALVEDLSWYPAHTRLGEIALVAADTAAAMRELAAAIAVRDNYHSRVLLGAVSSRGGDPDGAARHLRAAIALEPFAAAPWLMLGEALEQGGATDRAAAIHAYSEFIERTPRDDPNRTHAWRRVVALRSRGGAGDSTAPPG